MFGFNQRADRAKNSKSRKASKKPGRRFHSFESLEDRSVLSGFSVINLNDHGAGSLRQAILDANNAAGADVINFNVAGTIKLTTGALPTIIDTVDIDGASAPGFTDAPLVEVNYNGQGGLQFKAGSDGSRLRSLSLVYANNNGVSISNTHDITVAGNYIGLTLAGAVAANRGNGLAISSSTDVTVGGDTALDRNVISGNRLSGISLSDASHNDIWGNYIGTDTDGFQALGNTGNGIVVSGGGQNTIGGQAVNVISGNRANGILLSANTALNQIDGNLIGLGSDGTTVLGNKQDGVKLSNSVLNKIGHVDPVIDVSYYNADDAQMQPINLPVSGWQGIRGGDVDGEYIMTGTSDSDGLVFRGSIDGVGTGYTVDYPLADDTSVYGPDNLGNNNVNLVGTYKNADYQTAPVAVHGFLYHGPLTQADLNQPGNYTQIDYPGAKYNYVHSTMGGLVVGNYDSPVDHGAYSLPFGPGHAFIYDIDSATFLADIVFPGALSNSAYGIWYNGGTSYTIVGGYGTNPLENFSDQHQPLDKAYMVDFDSASGAFTHWTSFEYPNGVNFITHFQGISSVEKGIYTLSADSVQLGTGNPLQGSLVQVRRNADGSFGPATWADLNYTGLDPSTHWTSNDSVYGNAIVGIVVGGNLNGNPQVFDYQATINTGFQLSNVISGNGSNGIELTGSDDNEIAMNFIGTDYTGTRDRGNVGNGILITGKSITNMIGGEATGGNDPTDGVYVRPPQGNLISGNNANGVLITGGASNNQLSGNFIGTTASGNLALGNSKDGVLIDKANGNLLIGCTFEQNPFVYYNVISGNLGNGLHVKNSNDTTIQANFFGMGADNDHAVGNLQNGVLVEGSSTRTTMGGPIPLGNVSSANGQNGIYLKDHASYFISYNTFCGVAAFTNNPNYGNHQDGIHVTSDGGNNLFRTNVIAENLDDGIDISGSAKDVRVAGNIIGMNWDGVLPMGNGDNGIEISGKAHNNIIGGPQPTFNLIPLNIISSNDNNGVAILGKAHDNSVNNSYIGTDVFGTAARGNGNAGIYLSTGSYSNTIGSTDADLATVIAGNDGNGIEMHGTKNNTVIGSYIGTNAQGLSLGNAGNGIYLADKSNNNTIGGTASGAANAIANNGGVAVYIVSGTGNGILQNSIYDNAAGILLASGANNNQPAPVLTSVQSVSGGIQIDGTLTAKANTTFTLEFFANDQVAEEGQTFLGSITVKTNKSGVATFSFTTANPPGGTASFTATATDPKNNTSMFSNVLV